MNIFSYFRKKGIDTVDASFYRKIDEWISWYNSNVRQFTFYKVNTGRGTSKRCRRKSIGMAKKLSEDIADLLLNERVMITLEDEMTQEFVQKVLDNNHFLVMGNDYQERKAYSGTVAYIPYLYNAVVQEDGTISAGEIGINYVDAKNIYPVSWNNGNVTECVFTFVHTVRQKKYVQIQFHRIESNGMYVIENNVLRNLPDSKRKTIIESIREYMRMYPDIDNRKINIDRLGNGMEYSIDPIGADPIYKRYVDGSCLKQFQFALTSKEAYDGDARTGIANSGFYQNFEEWTEQNNLNDIVPELDGHDAIRVEVLQSGYLFSTEVDLGRYQMICRLIYE